MSVCYQESNFKTEPILNKALAVAKFALIFALSLIWLSTVWAEEVDQKGKNDADAYKLNEIVVTAEKIKQNIQDVPISISALSATQIEDAGDNLDY